MRVTARVTRVSGAWCVPWVPVSQCGSVVTAPSTDNSWLPWGQGWSVYVVRPSLTHLRGCGAVAPDAAPCAGRASGFLPGGSVSAPGRVTFFQLLPLIQSLFIEPNPAPVKTALALEGLIEDELRVPMQRSSEAMVTRLKEVLDALAHDNR